jgi:hypothetical protein
VPSDPSQSTFTKTPHWLLATDLSDGALRVYAALGMYADYRTGKGAFPSVATLRAATRMSDSTVRRHLRDLLAVGAIERHERFRENGSQTSSEVWLIADPPVISDSPRSNLTAPPVKSDTPITRAPLPTTSPTDVVEDHSLGAPITPTVPNSESLERPTGLPLVRRRELLNAGVTEDGLAQWEQAWTTVTSMQWPEWAQMEADLFPDDHLAAHVSKTAERGFRLSPSKWIEFFIDDRQRQIGYVRARLDQEARIAEDPAEREARQNRHLPPDRTDLDPPATPLHSGVQG